MYLLFIYSSIQLVSWCEFQAPFAGVNEFFMWLLVVIKWIISPVSIRVYSSNSHFLASPKWKQFFDDREDHGRIWMSLSSHLSQMIFKNVAKCLVLKDIDVLF